MYSSMGISNITNIPGSRDSAYPWIDKLGNIWVFGGHGHSEDYSLGILSDVWEYNPNTSMWTWRSGVLTPNNPSVYGIRKVPDIHNMIGGRGIGSSTIDAQKNFWLFGGQDDAGQNYYNDLWECKFYGAN